MFQQSSFDGQTEIPTKADVWWSQQPVASLPLNNFHMVLNFEAGRLKLNSIG